MGHDVSPTRVLRPRPDSPEGEGPRNLHERGSRSRLARNLAPADEGRLSGRP
jgi:hypothetical protein